MFESGNLKHESEMHAANMFESESKLKCQELQICAKLLESGE